MPDDDLAHLPPYARIATQIRRRIAQRDWQVGQALPAQRQLAIEYGVTTATLSRAIGTLISDGVLTTSSGHGTFVAKVPQATDAPVEPRRQSVPTTEQQPPAGEQGMSIAVLAPCDHDPLSVFQSSDAVTDGVTRGIERVVTANRGRLRFYRIWHGGFPSVEAAFAAACADGTRGVILMNILDYAGVDRSAHALVATTDVPLMYIPGALSPYSIAQVGYQHLQAGFAAGEHLLAQGYRQIVAVRSVDASWCDQRVAGVTMAVKHLGNANDAACEVLEAALPLVRSHGLTDADLASEAAGYLKHLRAASWWGGSRRVAAVLPNDRFALALLGAMREQGLEPGRQLGAIGFDDSSAARMAGLTSVSLPLEALGTFAAEAVLRSGGRPLPVTSTSLPCAVAGRASTYS